MNSQKNEKQFIFFLLFLMFLKYKEAPYHLKSSFKKKGKILKKFSEIDIEGEEIIRKSTIVQIQSTSSLHKNIGSEKEHFSFIKLFWQFFKKSKEKKEIEIYPKQPSNISKQFTAFILLMMLVLKTIRTLKWRTQSLRKLNFINEKQILYINYLTYFQEISRNTLNFSFIKNRFIRRKFKALKKSFIYLYVCFSKYFFIYKII